MIYRIVGYILITAGCLTAQIWEPVTPEQLNQKTPKLDANADAEAIFWQARVTDTIASGYSLHKVGNYKRIKIYNERGVKRWGNVEIPYFSEAKMSIAGIAARTIQPDGSIVEVKGSAVFDTTMQKAGKSKIKVKSFAFPSLQPGSIIDFQYEEVFSEFLPRYIELPLQLEIPAWEVTYFVKPIQSPYFPYQMRYYPFNCRPSAWEPAKGAGQREGFVVSTLKSVPAFVEEPRMPAAKDVRLWMLLYYTETSRDKPDNYWKNSGKVLAEEFKKDVKSSGEIKALAAELTAGKDTPFAKAQALAVYCQTKIGNVNYSADGMTSEIRDRYYKKLYKPEYSANDTLKNKLGTSRDIIVLFYSLAQAAGLNPIYARASNSSAASFRVDFLDPYLLSHHLVVFRQGETLSYFDPGNPYLPAGMLDSSQQGQAAVLVEAKEAKLVTLPSSEPAQSEVRRFAQLKMNAEGGISGHMRYDYTGLLGAAEKSEYEDRSPGSREEAKKKELEQMYPAAVIENLKIVNATSPVEPVSLEFDIKMDGFGQRTGKRLFFQPAIFDYGSKPLFSAVKRQHPIVFDGAFSETDTIRIEMPEGYSLENATVPGVLKLGEIGEAGMNAAVGTKEPVLSVTRTVKWGNKGITYFEPKFYPAVKQVWELIHQVNTQTLTLRAK